MSSARLVFPLLGLVSIAIGWPLLRRRVPPNRWYGIRVRATLADPAVWYQANAACGGDLVRLGAVLLAVSVALAFMPGLPDLGYVAICSAVFLAGSSRAVGRGIRIAQRGRGDAPGAQIP